MSKDQKETIELPVETVDNWKKAIDQICSSIRFWFPRNENDWPYNFFIENLNFLSDEIDKSIMPF